MGRETARALNEARETLAAWSLRMAAANKRMAELERELAAARELLSRRQNEIHSLEKSFGLSAGENLRLADLLAKSSATVDKRTSQLAQARLALKEVEAERNEAKRKARGQVAALHADLEAMTARATAAEKQVSDAQGDLLASGAENSRSQRRFATLQISLQEKEDQVQALKKAQSKLIERIKSRDTALARAEDKIASLAALFLQLEAKAGTQAKETDDAETLGEGQERAPLAEESGAKFARTDCAMLRRDLDSDDWLFGREFSLAS